MTGNDSADSKRTVDGWKFAEKAIVAMLEEWRARRDERALRQALGRLIAGL